MNTSLQIIVHTDEDGEFWGEVVDMPGCFSQGTTRAELMRNIKDAMACYWEATVSR